MRRIMQAVCCGLVCLGLGCVFGCQPETEPIERVANRMIDEVISPAIDKAATELSQRSAMLQGQGSFINPGYVMNGYGIVGTGFVWTATVRLDGVSANLSGATQADQGPDLDAKDEASAEPVSE